MNRPESIHLFVDLQGSVLDYLWVMGKALTLAEIQMGFAGLGGDDLQAVLDALVAAGEVERVESPSPFLPILETLPRYRAMSREEGRDDA